MEPFPTCMRSGTEAFYVVRKRDIETRYIACTRMRERLILLLERRMAYSSYKR